MTVERQTTPGQTTPRPSTERQTTPGQTTQDRTTRELMEAGEPYIAADPELGQMSARAQDLMATYNSTTAAQGELRQQLLSDLLGSVGEDVEIRPPLYVDYGRYLTVGARTFVNYGLVALDVARITMGDDVQIGPNVQLLTPTHPVDPVARREKFEAAEPITIGDNVWIGGGAIICPGVTIGADTVVGAGAVVTKDLPSGVVAVGNPARVIKKVTD